MKKNEANKDKRFVIAHREALFGIVLVVFNFLWWFGFAYGLGSKDVSNYQYVFGFPAWFFYSCIVGFIVMLILVIVVVKKWFTEVPFNEQAEKGDHLK
ncbi:YhdT family protein [Bacillus sp. FJAT-47783]|uniref:YhdT family protein n=1 Tax=Bacillus sp. FJAT-47783 TaxID=2922712 RepID=UPI001FAC6AF8|nr:YhdT family protein [Bacillus sp. FJAT-47783]